MSESPSFKIRLLGGLAGCVVGAVLGVLIGMAYSKAIFAAVLGGCIGLICGFGSRAQRVLSLVAFLIRFDCSAVWNSNLSNPPLEPTTNLRGE